MTRHASLLLLLALALSSGCASVPVVKDEAFTYSVEAVQENRFVQGADAAYNFLDAADPDDPRYDRGLRLLATACEGMGLRFAAALIYREIAQTRRNMELVPHALQGIERIVATRLYDEDTLITSFIAAEEFGYLPPETAAFVAYYKGLDLARRGEDEWAEVNFSALPETSPFSVRADYVRAVRMIADGNFPEARELLEEMQERDAITPELARDVERALARLAFEEQRYGDALAHFQTLEVLAPDDPEILLETAWTYYYQGDSRKTLGLLVALDAPVHESFISPERYLLEALALRRLCQFDAARAAAVSLERRYDDALDDLARGDLPEDIPEIREAARRRGFSKDNAVFLDRLLAERAVVPNLRVSDGLRGYLDDLYERGLVEAERKEEERITRDADALAEEMLSSREGVRLIVHELGVSLLRGRRRPPGALEKPAVVIPVTGEHAFYPFAGEYWTDEMDDLEVIAEDRCIE
jgi:hypothetical protein